MKNLKEIKLEKGTYTIKFNEFDKEYTLYFRGNNGFQEVIKEAKKLSTIEKYIID